MKKFLLMIALIFAVTTYTFAQDPARDFLERSNPNYLDQLDRVLNDIEHKVYNKKISKSALDKVISALQAQQKKITKPSNCDLNCVLALNEKKLTYTFIINSLLNIQKKYFNVSTTTPRPTTPGTTNPNSSNGDADSTVPVDVLSIQNLFSGYVYL